MAVEARRLRSPLRLMDVLCAQLVLEGVPLVRSTWAMQPPIGGGFGYGLGWRPGKPVREQHFDEGELIEDRFQHSPFRALIFGGEPIRRKLLDPDLELDFPILEELRGKGLMVGLKCAEDGQNAALNAKLTELGMLTALAGDNVLRMVPPLIITNTQVDEALAMLREACDTVSAEA